MCQGGKMLSISQICRWKRNVWSQNQVCVFPLHFMVPWDIELIYSSKDLKQSKQKLEIALCKDLISAPHTERCEASQALRPPRVLQVVEQDVRRLRSGDHVQPIRLAEAQLTWHEQLEQTTLVQHMRRSKSWCIEISVYRKCVYMLPVILVYTVVLFMHGSSKSLYIENMNRHWKYLHRTHAASHKLAR